jgi:hypothetical protein
MKINWRIKWLEILLVVSLCVELKHFDYKFGHIFYFKLDVYWFFYLEFFPIWFLNLYDYFFLNFFKLGRVKTFL